MVIHGFDMYRVFISSPGDLFRENEATRAAISQINENEAMPRKILLVSVGLREHGDISGFRSAVAENIRQCTWFIQIFHDDWGPGNLFRKMFHLALECRDDPAFPMREVVVLLKDDSKETDPQILAFREELRTAPGVRFLTFTKSEQVSDQLPAVCSAWAASIPGL